MCIKDDVEWFSFIIGHDREGVITCAIAYEDICSTLAVPYDQCIRFPALEVANATEASDKYLTAMLEAFPDAPFAGCYWVSLHPDFHCHMRYWKVSGRRGFEGSDTARFFERLGR